MSIKKTLASIASYALVGAVALGVGGTLAQQNETTQTDVNVQTVGIVDIAQLEYERVVDATKGEADNEPNNANWVALPEYATEFNGVTYIPDALQKFTQGKSMAPAYYSKGEVMWDDRTGYSSETDPNSHQQPWKEIGAPGSNRLFDDSISNVLDKFVFVQNTGEKDAYVRTVFAFEKGIFTADDYNDGMVHLNRNTEATGTNWKWTPFSESMKATIEGTEYYLTVATYNRGDGIVKPTEITRPSLLQVFFDPAVENKHIKALGDTYNILAISQAVQADLSPNLNAEESLNAVFGEVTAETHPWVNGIKVGFEVSNDAELAAAIKAGETEIWLNAGEYNVANCGGKTLTINGSKNAVLKLYNEGEDGCDYGFGAAGTGEGNITFNGVTVDTTANNGNYKGYAYMKATFNDCNFVGSYCAYRDLAFNNCTFDFKNGYFWTWGAEELTFDSCTFNGNSKTILAHGTTTTVININDCTFAATEKGYTGSGDNTAVVEIDPVGNNTYTINFTGNNTKTDNYAGWYRVKDSSTGHTFNGVD